ncbi:tetraspanin-36-like [Clavelina lepadiformis]|uniref:Tetraspanin n=1 Tax=Clavelina lepadiformis TaxID=159417 RepID=A0ABP0G3M0_CLALP
MSCCKTPLKCVLFVLNLLFWAAGGFLLYAGISFIQSNYGSTQEVNSWPAVILICTAGVLIIGGLIGCVGAIAEKKTCLGLFLVFLGSVLIVQASISGVMFAQRHRVDDSFSTFLLGQFKDYGNSTAPATNSSNSEFNTTDFIDSIQEHWKCCGYHGYKDWQNNTWAYDEKHVPVSCCRPHNTSTNATCTGSVQPADVYMIYTEGCSDPLSKAFRWIYNFLKWSALSIAVLILIGVVIVIGLLCHQRNRPLGYSELSPRFTEV